MGRGILSNTKGVGRGFWRIASTLARSSELLRRGQRNVGLLLEGSTRKRQSGHVETARRFGGSIVVGCSRDERMALTRDFKVTVRERLQRDPSFRKALLEEAVDCLLSSDVETGKSLLRDYVNATIGFGELGGLTDRSPKSLMRMLRQKGNPQARNLFEIIGCLQHREGVHLKVQAIKVANNAA